MKCLATWRFAEQSIEDGNPVMLLYVIETRGSSPGRQGNCMAVSYEGSSAPLAMEGTIGGGVIERKIVDAAREKLMNEGEKPETGTLFRQKSTPREKSGTTGAGEQTVFMYQLQQKDRPVLSHIISSLEHNQNGALTLTPAGISFSDSQPVKEYEFTMHGESDWRYTEKTGYKNRLFIIGGGHCSLALSRLMRGMDFYVRIYDDRSNLKTMLVNDAANEKHVLKNYSELTDLIDAGDDHYVVVMTMSYETDDIALRALTGKKFRYIGVLGSRSKIQRMMKEYKTDGIENTWLSQIHAPVGLSIKSQSPEEIAVSIAAEIIQVKNRFPATTLPARAVASNR